MLTGNDSKLISKHWAVIFFITAITAIYFIQGYYQHFFDGPGGIHYIRQTDSLAFIDHYVDNGYNFFKPGTLNLDSEKGNAACEFPVLYYFISFLYGGFGKHYFFLRLINLLISIIGLYHLFKLGQKLFKDDVYALLLPFFLFTSTVFNYYIFNFLPDVTALGMTFVGWNLCYNEFGQKKPKWSRPFLFFTLAGLIKVTYFISPIALISYILFQRLKGLRSSYFKNLLITFSLSVLLIIIWNLFVIFYNIHFEAEYFTTGARPIFGMTQSEIDKTWDHIFNFWFNDYFAHSSRHFILGIIVFQLILIKKGKQTSNLLTAFSFFGGICYFILFFSQFKDHDYYFLTLLPIIIILLGNGILTLQNHFKKHYIHWVVKVGLTIIIIIGITYSSNKVHNRFDNRLNFISQVGIRLEAINDTIDLKLPVDSKILILGDPSKNGSLLALNRQGWTIPSIDFYTKDTLQYFLASGLTHIIFPTSLELMPSDQETDGQIWYRDSLFTIFNLSSN